MICKNCNAQIEDDSVFCTHCGAKIIVDKQIIEDDSAITRKDAEHIRCPKCKNDLPHSAKFCPNCGEKPGLSKKIKILSLIGGSFVVVLAIVGFIFININAQKSPIEGVSKKVYEQGMQYLEDMNSDVVKEYVVEFMESNYEMPLGQVADNITEVSFQLELGKNPSSSEVVFNDIINEIWRNKCIIYVQESLLETISEDTDSSSVNIAATIFKGVIYEQKDKLKDAADSLKAASTYDDLVSVYNKASVIYTDSEKENKEANKSSVQDVSNTISAIVEEKRLLKERMII